MAISLLRPLNILLIGGTGHWSEKKHYPTLLALRRESIPNRVIAICDPANPYTTSDQYFAIGRKNLHYILTHDSPMWIDPHSMSGKELENTLSRIHREEHIDIAIVACNPISHFFYSLWAIQHDISVLCDKPLVLLPDSSSSVENAIQIALQFSQLVDAVRARQRENPHFALYTLLRRRLARPYRTIADGLSEICTRTGQGITNMTVILNNGLHRYPEEFLKKGAHGYDEGVGSLCHSSYHYLDIIAWYLGLCRGNIARIGVSVPYVLRVGDYLRAKSYTRLMHLLGESELQGRGLSALPEKVLSAEMDFVAHFTLYDRDDNKIGLVTYANNHTTFTPRLAKYAEGSSDPGNEKRGGRTKHLYIDIHQGVAQQFVMARNDVTFETADIVRRLHPTLGQQYDRREYTKDEYEPGSNPTDLFRSFVLKRAGIQIPETHDEYLNVWMTGKLTHDLFSQCYVKIAENYCRPSVHVESSISLGS